MFGRLSAAKWLNVERMVIPLATNFINPGTLSWRARHDDTTKSFDERYISVDTDPHYEQVRKQAFGPIPLSQSSPKGGKFTMTSAEFETRPNQVFGGVAYTDLPIVLIRAMWNNTHIVTSVNNKVLSTISCRTVGFFNAKKKTEVAAETVGAEAAERCINKGCHKYVRVVVRGIGSGRKPAMRGLVRGGMEIVSITDRTAITNESLSQRPRKIRRI